MPTEKPGKTMSDKPPRFVSIWQPRDPVQAGIIREALKQSDVNVYIDNETMSSVRFGGIGIGAAGMNVMVPENEAEQARKILADIGIE